MALKERSDNTQNVTPVERVNRAASPERKARLPKFSLVELLQDTEAVFRRFLHMHEPGYTILPLYVAYAHTYERHEHCPRLMFRSPIYGSGKTTGMSILSKLMPGAELLSVGTAAYITAMLDQAPCVLLDEVDKYGLEARGVLTGILNSGFTRPSAWYGKMVTDENGKWVPSRISTFKPLVFASKGKDLPADLASRTIVIDMPKLRPEDKGKVEPFRAALAEPALQRLMTRWEWWAGKLPKEKRFWHDMPAIDPRRCDVWRPLFALAEEAGGEWLRRVREAQAAEPALTQEIGVKLLADIKRIFDETGAERTTTEDLLAKLVDRGLEWAEWRNGKPITARSLGALLKPFNIASDSLELGKVKGKRVQRQGYWRRQFEEAWAQSGLG